jgi:hypothetical protein
MNLPSIQITVTLTAEQAAALDRLRATNAKAGISREEMATRLLAVCLNQRL